jgi:hypothetical protein
LLIALFFFFFFFHPQLLHTSVILSVENTASFALTELKIILDIPTHLTAQFTVEEGLSLLNSIVEISTLSSKSVRHFFVRLSLKNNGPFFESLALKVTYQPPAPLLPRILNAGISLEVGDWTRFHPIETTYFDFKWSKLVQRRTTETLPTDNPPPLEAIHLHLLKQNSTYLKKFNLLEFEFTRFRYVRYSGPQLVAVEWKNPC